jgi:competence protein ComEC
MNARLMLAASGMWLILGCSEKAVTPASAPNPMAGASGLGAAASGGADTQGGRAPNEAGAANAGRAGQASSSGGQAGAMAGEAGAAGAGSGADELVLFWVDVEGGASTLMRAPDGQVVVVDTGFPGARDAGRIAKALQEELHADHIDYLITTHFHDDHVGGVTALAGMLPVAHFYDHGATVQTSSQFDEYVATAGAKRVIAKAGDKLQLGALALTFVTSAGEVIDPPLASALPNDTCPSNVTKTMDGGAENAMSLGFVAEFGGFRFLDLADLVWAVEQKLMCPTNRIGNVDLYQVNHHGMDISNSPQLVHALAPTVAIMNNGASKGGSAATFDVLNASPGLQGLWSLHQVTKNDAQHNAEPDLTANLSGGEDAAHGLRAVVSADGSYSVSNGRNRVSRKYTAR